MIARNSCLRYWMDKARFLACAVQENCDRAPRQVNAERTRSAIARFYDRNPLHRRSSGQRKQGGKNVKLSPTSQKLAGGVISIHNGRVSDAGR